MSNAFTKNMDLSVTNIKNARLNIDPLNRNEVYFTRCQPMN